MKNSCSHALGPFIGSHCVAAISECVAGIRQRESWFWVSILLSIWISMVMLIYPRYRGIFSRLLRTWSAFPEPIIHAVERMKAMRSLGASRVIIKTLPAPAALYCVQQPTNWRETFTIPGLKVSNDPWWSNVIPSILSSGLVSILLFSGWISYLFWLLWTDI
jgi:hypothetical protein